MPAAVLERPSSLSLPPVTPIPRAERVVVRGVSWEMYEHLLHDHENRSAPRFTYDRGTLEIMSPLAVHEESNRTLATIVEAITEEWAWDIRNLGSTTFRSRAARRGSEPDSCFYIQSVQAIAGRQEVDLASHPAPDLVVEVDVTHPSLDKMPLYTQLGVSEVWRWSGNTLTIFGLEAGQYEPRSESRALAPLTADQIEEWLSLYVSLGRLAWLRRVRAWAQQNSPGSSPSP